MPTWPYKPLWLLDADLIPEFSDVIQHDFQVCPLNRRPALRKCLALWLPLQSTGGLNQRTLVLRMNLGVLLRELEYWQYSQSVGGRTAALKSVREWKWTCVLTVCLTFLLFIFLSHIFSHVIQMFGCVIKCKKHCCALYSGTNGAVGADIQSAAGQNIRNVWISWPWRPHLGDV